MLLKSIIKPPSLSKESSDFLHCISLMKYSEALGQGGHADKPHPEFSNSNKKKYENKSENTFNKKLTVSSLL